MANMVEEYGPDRSRRARLVSGRIRRRRWTPPAGAAGLPGGLDLEVQGGRPAAAAASRTTRDADQPNRWRASTRRRARRPRPHVRRPADGRTAPGRNQQAGSSIFRSCCRSRSARDVLAGRPHARCHEAERWWWRRRGLDDLLGGGGLSDILTCLGGRRSPPDSRCPTSAASSTCPAEDPATTRAVRPTWDLFEALSLRRCWRAGPTKAADHRQRRQVEDPALAQVGEGADPGEGRRPPGRRPGPAPAGTSSGGTPPGRQHGRNARRR